MDKLDKKPAAEEKPQKKVAEAKPQKKKASKKMQVIYTHNKKFEVPADVKLEDFLKEKYPEEYK